jgi:hypothetical protein
MFIDFLAEGLGAGLDIESFLGPQQIAVRGDTAKLRAIISPRRTGKTTLLAALGILDTVPKREHPFICTTIGHAEKNIHPIFEELREKYGLDIHLDKQNNRIYMPNKSWFQLYGMGSKKDISRIRGSKCPGIIVDECGAADEDNLREMILEAALPSTMDYVGRGGFGVVLAGTPGEFGGFWHKIVLGEEFAASVHRFTLEGNPLFTGRVEEILAELRKTYKLSETSTTYRREMLGEFCVDTEGRCYPHWNGQLLPQDMAPCEGRTVLGVDFGLRDPNAWVVLRFRGNQVHVLYAYKQNNMTHDEIWAHHKAVVREFSCGEQFGDSFGMGAQTIHTLRTSYGSTIEPHNFGDAQNRGKDRIMFADSLAGSGNLFIYQRAECLSREMNIIPWNAEGTGHHAAYDNHACSALHVGLSSALQTYRPPKAPDPGEQERALLRRAKAAMARGRRHR